MSYIDTPGEDDAAGELRDLYQAERDQLGYLPNYTRAFGFRPDVYAAWGSLNRAIRAGMQHRRYELATLAAARRLRSSYCSLAHATVLSGRYVDPGTLRDIVTDHRGADLDPVDTAVLDFADKAARDAAGITAQDVQALRDTGLTDDEIFHVALAVAARCFFSTVLDAIGVEPDAHYRDSLEPELRHLLTVGRPIAEAEPPGAGPAASRP